MPIVFPPMRDNWLISLSEAMPVTNEENTSGTAINFEEVDKDCTERSDPVLGKSAPLVRGRQDAK